MIDDAKVLCKSYVSQSFICLFHIHGFSQMWIKNIWEKNFQKAKLEFILFGQLFTWHLH